MGPGPTPLWSTLRAGPADKIGMQMNNKILAVKNSNNYTIKCEKI